MAYVYNVLFLPVHRVSLTLVPGTIAQHVQPMMDSILFHILVIFFSCF